MVVPGSWDIYARFRKKMADCTQLVFSLTLAMAIVPNSKKATWFDT